MSMKELEWLYPQNLEEVPAMLEKKGVFLHGGGTGILKSGLSRVSRLIDLSKLPINYFREKSGRIEIGASQTYADVVENIKAVDPDHILVKALGEAANTPLRNRITIGGSIALFPPWSDLMGPLVALEADVSLLGSNNKNVKIADLASNRGFAKGNLITGIGFALKRRSSYYYREGRTIVDYPTFTVTVLLSKTDDVLRESRVVISGCTGRFKRLTDLEDYINGRGAGDIDIGTAVDLMDVSFPGKKNLKPEYLRHLAAVSVSRGLESLIKGAG
jgi:CO/xanthine dehydrogenase FAD-binding subunit